MENIIESFKIYFVNKTVIEWILFGISVIAIIEWFTFLIINIRTFLNVIRNPDKTTGSGRAIFFLISYVVIRCLFLPFYLAGAAINIPVYSEKYQPLMYKIATIILTTWWNMVILLPCVTVWYSRLRYGIGNKAKPDTREPYNFVVVLPVYNETIELLVEGVDSIINSNYPKSLIQIHVSFDSDELSKLYLGFVQHYNMIVDPEQKSMSTVVDGVTMWVHRFPHAGKRLTQAATWEFVKDLGWEKRDPERTILLFTDSDNYMYDNAIKNLAYSFERNTKKLAFAGYMTCMSSGSFKSWADFTKMINPMRLLQDTEYVGGEMSRSYEILGGSIACLPGGFTAMRYGAFDSVADKYFTTLAEETATDFQRNFLGEDRYLTHLMHEYLPRHSLGFCPSARCKTDPPTTFMKMVMQRRRWFLGGMSNEAYMFSSKPIWKKYKMMIVYKFLQLALWRSFTISQIILAILMIRGLDFGAGWNGVSAQVMAMVIPLVLSWIMISWTGIAIGHYKVIFVYPFSHLPQMLLAFFVDWKVAFTFNQRSWGKRAGASSNVASSNVTSN